MRQQRNAGDIFIAWEIRTCAMKTLRKDCITADWKMSLPRPAAGGESFRAGFFLVLSGKIYLLSGS